MRRPLRYGLAASVLVIAGLVPGWTGHAIAAGSTVYVSPTGNDVSGSGTSSAPFATVGHAVSTASAGSTIIMEPGIYKEMVTISQQLTLESDSSQPNAASTTIIDATGQTNGILIQGGATAGTVINGLTVQNAQAEGILANGTTNLTIENNIVQHNDQSIPANYTGDLDLEALHINGVTNSSILNNTVQNNNDGGIYLTDEAGPTTGNTVSGNQSLSNGIDCGITLANHNPAGGISNNIVENNVSNGNGAPNSGSAGIGIFSPVPGGQARNNQVLNNTAMNNAGAGIEIHAHSTGQDLSGNVIDGNTLSGNGNDFGFPMTFGIFLGAEGGSPIMNTSLTNNTISNEDVGIGLLNAPGTLIAGNTITANNVSVLTAGISSSPQNGPPVLVTAVPNITLVNGGTTASFTVQFTSTNPGQGEVYFGSGPGCLGLVQVATQDKGAGTTNHSVVVTGNDLPGTIGNIGIQPGATYYYEVLTVSPSGTEVDNGNGACYSVSIPRS
jgi:parallel beta-helix repeat protein